MFQHPSYPMQWYGQLLAQTLPSILLYCRGPKQVDEASEGLMDRPEDHQEPSAAAQSEQQPILQLVLKVVASFCTRARYAIYLQPAASHAHYIADMLIHQLFIFTRLHCAMMLPEQQGKCCIKHSRPAGCRCARARKGGCLQPAP